MQLKKNQKQNPKSCCAHLQNRLALKSDWWWTCDVVPGLITDPVSHSGLQLSQSEVKRSTTHEHLTVRHKHPPLWCVWNNPLCFSISSLLGGLAPSSTVHPSLLLSLFFWHFWSSSHFYTLGCWQQRRWKLWAPPLLFQKRCWEFLSGIQVSRHHRSIYPEHPDSPELKFRFKWEDLSLRVAVLSRLISVWVGESNNNLSWASRNFCVTGDTKQAEHTKLKI